MPETEKAIQRWTIFRCHAQGRKRRYSGEWQVADGKEIPDPENSILITEVETVEVAPVTELETAKEELALVRAELESKTVLTKAQRLALQAEEDRDA